jgi:hypothetical protein
MDQNVKLELNVQMLNIVLAGLAKLPLEQSIDTFNFIRQQANAQLQQSGPAPEGPLASKVIN